jgi:DNA-binding NarL/FixJ family response regulator
MIVDDHPRARDAIRTALLFCHSRDAAIVGAAIDGAATIEMARQSARDVITMDISLSDMSGLRVTRRLKMELPRVEEVVTVHEEREYGEEAVKAGAAHRGLCPVAG